MKHYQKGMLIYLLAIFLLTLMDASVKWLSHAYPIGQVVFFRVVFAFVPIGLIFLKNRKKTPFKTKRHLLHIVRGLLVICTIGSFFYSLRYLPLADTTAIVMVAPLFSIALGAIILKENVTHSHWIAGIVGFAGVIFIFPPGEKSLQLVALVAVLAAFLYSLTSIVTRILGSTEGTLLITFYSHFVMMIVSLFSLFWGWETPTLPDLMVFFIIGLAGGTGGFLLTLAFKFAPVSILAPLDYTVIFWATVLGFILWGDIPTIWVAIGTTMVIASGLYISRINGK